MTPSIISLHAEGVSSCRARYGVFNRANGVMKMTITGRVLHVRETWPLQFVVATGQQRCDVSLRDDTRVERQGVQVDPGELQPGSTVEVSGDGDESGMTANVVVIL